MGSLYSKPRLPEQTVYVQPAPAPVLPQQSADVPAPENDDAQKAAGVVRRRALPQTILTSFRGILGQGEWAPARKSLLGE